MDARPLKKLIIAIAAPAFLLSGCSSSNVPSGTSLEGNQPASIQLIMSPQTVLASGTSNVIAVVLDGNGNPVPDGTSVLFSVAPSPNGAAFTATGTAIGGTGVTLDGQAPTTLTAGTTAGEVLVEAVAGTITQRSLVTVQASTAAVTPVTPDDATATLTTIRVVGSSDTIPADGTSTVLLTATLVDNNDASDTQGAKQVTFQTDLGVLRAVGSSTIGRTLVVTTDGNGQAQAVLVAANNPGVATVTASAEGVEGLLTVANFGRPASIILDTDNLPNPDPAEIAVTGSGRQENSTIFFRVLDSNGSPVLANATRTVEFMILNGGLGGGERLSPGVGVGAAITNGLAKTVVRSGTRAGTVKVIAFIQTPLAEASDLVTTIGGTTVSSASLTTLPTIVAGAPALQLKILFGPDEGAYRITTHTAGSNTVTITPVTPVAGGFAFRSSSTGIPFRVDNGRVDPGEVVTNAVEIGITGDLPSGENFSIRPEFFNIAGRVTAGLIDEVTAYLADRFNNAVPAGTSVNFTTYDEATLNSVAQVLGAERVTLETSEAVSTVKAQLPSPSDGFVRVEAQSQSGRSAHVRSLAVDNRLNSATSGTLFAGTDGGGTFRAPDPKDLRGQGAQWIQAGRGSSGLFNGMINDLAIDPADSSLLFAGTDDGVYRTISSGEVWDDASGRGLVIGDTPNFFLTCIDATGAFVAGTVTAPNPLPSSCPGNTVGQVNLLLNFDSSRRRSKTRVVINNQETTNYAYDTTDPRIIRLFNVPCPATPALNTVISVDYELGNSLPSDVPVRAVVINPNPVATPRQVTVAGQLVTIDTKIVYAGILGRGVWRSTDGGFSWNQEVAGLGNQNIQCLAYDAVNNVLYAGTLGGGVYRSSVDDRDPTRNNVGALDHAPLQWTSINGSDVPGVRSSLLFKDVRALQIVPVAGVAGVAPLLANRNIIVAGTRLGGLWFAEDLGTITPDWNEAAVNIQDESTLIINTTVTELAFKPAGIGSADAEIFAAAIDDDDPQNLRGGVYVAQLVVASPGATLTVRETDGLGFTSGFDDVSTTQEDKKVRAIAIDLDADNGGASPVLYAGTDDRNVFRKALTPASGTASNLADDWVRINDRQGFFPDNSGSFPDTSLPAAIRTEIYATTDLLFSGPTDVPQVQQVADSIRQLPGGFALQGPINDIPNLGSQVFRMTIADDFGNPLVSGSTITVASNAGTLEGEINVIVADTLRGQTEFEFRLTNEITGTTEQVATITVEVVSPITGQPGSGNGNREITLSRRLLTPVEIISSGSVTGTVVRFTASDGSLSGHFAFTVTGAAAIVASGRNFVDVLMPVTGSTVTVQATNVNVGSASVNGVLNPVGAGTNGVFVPCDSSNYGNNQSEEISVTATDP